ncbi:hypothetical protein EV363DRAFT_1296691 [Boletus edulis]|nr:hypothetical protein EV363DRAFT_1296691 [Boletus edulis]
MPNKLYRLSRTWGKGVLLSCQWWWWWWDEEEHALHRRDLVVTRWLGQISQCLCCPKVCDAAAPQHQQDAKCQEEKGSLDDLEEVDSEEIEGQVDDLAGKLLDSCPKNDLVVFVDSHLLQGSEEKADGSFSSLLQEANLVPWLPLQIVLLERKLKPMRSKVEVFTREELLPENTTIKKGEKAAKPRQWLHKSKGPLSSSKSGWKGSTMIKKADKKLMQHLIDSGEIWDILGHFVEKLLDEVVIELQKLISGALNNEKERQRFAGAIKGEHFPCLLGKHRQ